MLFFYENENLLSRFCPALFLKNGLKTLKITLLSFVWLNGSTPKPVCKHNQKFCTFGG